MTKRKTIFRLDDICPQMNAEKFNRMKDIFLKYDVHPIIGVVPLCKDASLNCDDVNETFWQEMRQLKARGWTIAMHGCYHVYENACNGLISHGCRSEFAGLSYEVQLEKVQTGKSLLEKQGIYTDTFMAPSHSYDENTLRALVDCGFKYVTDGLTRYPYRYKGLVFVPCRESKIENVNWLSTVCYHTNVAHESRFIETEEYLKKYRDEVIDFQDALNMEIKDYTLITKIEEKLFYFYKYYLKEFAYKVLKQR